MSITAFVLILSSILLHSLWHFLCKSSGRPSMAFFALFSSSLFLTMLPFALSSGLLLKLPKEAIIFACCGAFSGAICNTGLKWAYKYSDISLAYPMARALPVFLTLLITVLFGFGKSLTFCAVAGMLIIFTGCLMMALSQGGSHLGWKQKLFSLRKGLIGIVIASFGTTGYTIIDSYGMAVMKKFAPECNGLLLAGTYSCIREFSAVFWMWLLAVICILRGTEKGALKEMAKKYHPYAAGVFAALAYVLILLSMNYVTNVSFVQAFRQLSLPIGALLGYLILKEKITPFRWTALLLIMAGLFVSIL